MSNTTLSPTVITNEALAVLHNNLAFVKNINRQYDKQFANSGATVSGKSGPSLAIRKPNKYTIRKTAKMAVQDTQEESTTLTVSSRYGVDIAFTSEDLTLSIDEFSRRYIKPAMATIASNLDYDCMLAAYKTVFNTVDVNTTTGVIVAPPSTAATYLKAAQKLDENACPRDDERYVTLCPAAEAATVAGLQGLLNNQKTIGEQYTSGQMGTALGMQFGMSQNVPAHTCGTRTMTSPVTVVTSWANGQATLAVTGGTASGTYTAGDSFTIADIYACNPETKQSTGSLAQFVVTALNTASGGNVTLAISPTIYVSGAKQNVVPTTGSKALIFSGAASSVRAENLLYHTDAFTLVTSDLVLPKGVDFADRQVMDGISMRIIRDYDISDDVFPCRIDVLAGFKELYPQWACRVLGQVS